MEKLVIDISCDTPTFSISEVGIPGPQGIRGIQGRPMVWDDLTAANKLALRGEKLTYNDLTPGDKADLSQVAIEATKPYVKQAEQAFVASQGEAGKAARSASDAAASVLKALAYQTTSKPTPHTHPFTEITEVPEAALRWPTHDEVTNKPVEYPAAPHRQPWDTIDGIPDTAKRWPTTTEIGAFTVGDPVPWASLIDVPVTATRWPTPQEVGATPEDIGALPARAKAVDSEQLEGMSPSAAAAINTVVSRDSSGDSEFRMIKSTYQSQAVVPEGSSVAFRINNTDDSFVRFVSRGGLINWLGKVSDSNMFAGKTYDQMLTVARQGLIPDTATINGYSLAVPVNLTAADTGLGNVANYGNTSSCEGESTTLYATQKAVHDAARAPTLETERKRRVFYDNKPILPEEGDVFIIL